MFYVSIKNGGGEDWDLIYEPLNPELAIHTPKVTLEVGKSGSFTFNITEKNKYYNSLIQLTTLVLVEWGDSRSKTEIFRGRVFQISMNFSKMKSVTCEGILAYLVDSVQKAKKYNGKARALFQKIITAHNDMMSSYPEKKFTIGNVTIDNADIVIPGKKEDDDAYYNDKYAEAVIEAIDDEWLTTYDYINDILISYLGGYLVVRNVNGTNYIDYLKDEAGDNPSTTDGVTKIEYGVNLIDFTEEMDAEDLCTVVIPLGDSEDDKVLTIEGATNKTEDDSVEAVKIGGKYVGIAHKAAVRTYGWIVKTHSFSNVNKANTLFTDARKWLKSNRNIPTRYTIKAVDLQFIDPDSASSIIKLGEMIRMVSAPHKMDKTLMCTKIEYDIENPANNSYTLGNPEQSLTERYKKDKDKESKKSRSHSRKSAGAAGKAAGEEAEAVADDLDAATTDLEKKVSDATLVIDPDKGLIELQAWYDKHEDGFHRVGVNLDAYQGTVDVFATWNEVSDKEHGNAALKLLCDKNESSIEAVAEHVTETSRSVADLTLRTTALEAMFKLFAEYESQTSITQAGIEAKSDSQASELDIFAKWKDKNNDNINSIADIAMKANAYGATIDLLTKWNGEHANSLAQLNVWASGIESKIAMITDFQTATAATTASITTKSDANSALIDMLTQWKDKTEGSLNESLADIQMKVDAEGAAIEQYAKFVTNTSEALAQLNIRANAIESVIEQIATFTTDTAATTASITTKADANGALIDMLTEWKNKTDGTIKGLAQTKQWVDENGAGIEQVTNWYSDNGDLKGLTKILQWNDDKISQIEQATEFYAENRQALTNITQWSDEDSANIKSAAEYVNTKDSTTGVRSLASITQTVTNSKSEIENLAKWEKDTASSIASVTQTATDSESKISLIASFTGGKTPKLASINISASDVASAIGIEAEKVMVISKLISLGDKVYISSTSPGEHVSIKVPLVMQGNGQYILCPGGVYKTKKTDDYEMATHLWVKNHAKECITHGDVVGLLKGDYTQFNYYLKSVLFDSKYATSSWKEILKHYLDDEYAKKDTYNKHTHNYQDHSYDGTSTTLKWYSTKTPN